MSAYYVLFSVALSGLALCLISDDRIRRPFLWTYFAFLILLLALFAGLRSPHIDADYQNYLDWFDQLRSGSVGAEEWTKDPAFALVSFAVAFIGLPYLPVPFIYAFFALITKAVFTFSVTIERATAMYFFLVFSRFFVLLEMTQIRAAIAIPLMSLALYQACSRKPLKACILFAAALAFHLSVVIVLPIFVLILCGAEFHSRKWIFAALPIAIGANILVEHSLTGLLSVYRVSDYVRGQEAEHSLSLISFHFFMHVGVILLVTLFFWGHLSRFGRVAAISSTLGVIVYTAFISETTLASRFEQIFDLFWLYLFVVIFRRLSPRWYPAYLTAIGLLGFALFSSTIDIVQPYALWDTPR
jgi:hypothetical protein